MQTYRIELYFGKGLIEHPYWPERERLINIQKESGTKRARSEERRISVLKDYLAAHDMTLEEYEALEEKADRQFYLWRDVLNASEMNGHQPDEIVIPAHQLYGCLAQAASLASSALRIAPADQLRTVLRISDLATGKTVKDGTWERFVTVTSGTGAKLSNQRALRSNDYIEEVTAKGTLSFLDSIDAEKMQRFLEFAGREVGCGASRKMGWGRFDLRRFEPAGERV